MCKRRMTAINVQASSVIKDTPFIMNGTFLFARILLWTVISKNVIAPVCFYLSRVKACQTKWKDHDSMRQVEWPRPCINCWSYKLAESYQWKALHMANWKWPTCCDMTVSIRVIAGSPLLMQVVEGLFGLLVLLRWAGQFHFVESGYQCKITSPKFLQIWPNTISVSSIEHEVY